MVAPNLSRAHLIQGTRIMRFQELYESWRERRLSQPEAAEILGVCECSFLRYTARYEGSEGDLNSLADKRLSQASKRKAATGEIDALIALYQSRFVGWNVKHFCSHYQHHQLRLGQPTRSYTWVKSALQGAGLVPKVAGRGKHHHKRDPKPLVGMMIHQDGLYPRLGKRGALGLGHHHGRCHQRAPVHVLLPARRQCIEFSWDWPNHCPLWPVL